MNCSGATVGKRRAGLGVVRIIKEWAAVQRFLKERLRRQGINLRFRNDHDFGRKMALASQILLGGPR